MCVTPKKATLELYDRLSNPLIEVDAVVHKDILLDCVCDLGYGIAPGAVEDYTWFRRSRKRGVACTPAPHVQSKRKTIDERSER